MVVLDNVDACPDGSDAVSRILDALPSLVLLATCRVPLRRRSEHTVVVPPLAVPERGASPGEIEDSPAVQMFLRVAEQADGGGRPEGASRRALAEVCRLLDGSPLAIELAAARVRLMGLDGPAREPGVGPGAAQDDGSRRARAPACGGDHDRVEP